MALILNHVNYIYGNSSSKVKALDDVSLQIGDGEFVGVIGHTGSGKSTLIQHMNGLLKASEGQILYNGCDIYDKDYNLSLLRQKVGLVFQYPEHQLFETDVFTDVCFGPKNMKLKQIEVETRAYNALKQVGLDDDLWYRSPFELSGGQKKRAAIAGVLAMKPEILILDEPTAGLDPMGREEILSMIQNLQKETGMTIVLVSHSMEDVANYVERIVVMDQGRIIMNDVPAVVFSRYQELEKIGLAAPEVTYIMQDLRRAGFNVSDSITTINEACDEILKVLGR